VVSYYLADHLGSIVLTTSSSGSTTLTREYDSWGNLLQGSTASGYAFTGREWDPESGLYYYRARYYDPKAARFFSEDPIRWTGGFNFYGYVENNPINWRDPSGLKKRSSGNASTKDARAQTMQGLRQCRIATDFTEWEYCGVTCRKADGSYYYTWPDTAQDGGQCPYIACDPGETEVENWHTHAPPAGGRLNEWDVDNARRHRPRVPLCVGLVGGGVQCYDPNTNTQTCHGCSR
jgi:RHS repeat-associated protein